MTPLPNPSRNGAFLESLIRFLMPFFIDSAVDRAAARLEILETLGSYGTRTRAELLAAARIIAFGMATLDTLAEAKAADLSPSMRVRYRGCANGLNRSTIQNEKILDKRLAAAPPQPVDPVADTLNDLTDADVQASLDSAEAEIQAYRNRQTGTRPATTPASQQDPNKALWASAMRDTLNQMGLPNGQAPTG